MYALVNGRIYTGFQVLDNYALVVNNGLIEEVCPAETPLIFRKPMSRGQIFQQGLSTCN